MSTLQFNRSDDYGGSFAATISGAGNIAISGGFLALSVTNNYSGNTTIPSGTLLLGNQNAAQNSSVVMQGGNLQFATNSVTIGGLSGTGSGVGYDIALTSTSGSAVGLTFGGNAASTTYAGSFSGLGSLTKNGSGTVTLSGSNSFQGNVTVNSGILAFTGTNSLNSTITPSVLSGATLSVNSISNTLGGVARINLGGGSNTGRFLYTGAGESSNLTIGSSAGTFGSGVILDQSGSGPLVLTHDVALTSFIGTFILQGSTGGTGEFSGKITDGMLGTPLTKTGTGTWILSGSNTFSGPTLLNSGTLVLNNTNALQKSVLTMQGGQIQFATTNLNMAGLSASSSGVGYDIALSATNGSAATLTISGTSSTTYAGVLSGAGALTMSGTGALTLTNANPFSGSATVSNSGTLQLGNANAAQNSTVVVNVSNGLAFSPGIGTFNVGALSGGGSFALTDAGSSAVALIVGAINTSAVYSGVLSGAGSFTKVGSGKLTLGSTASSYAGATTISGGTLSVAVLAVGGSNSSIGASSSAAANLVINGGVLQYTGGTVSTDRNFTIGDTNATIDGGGTGALTLTGAAAFATADVSRTLTLTGTFASTSDGASSNRDVISGILADNGTGALSVVKNGTGYWLLSGSKSFSGGVTVNAGGLEYDNSGAIGTGTFTINGGIIGARSNGQTFANPVVVGGDFTIGLNDNATGVSTTLLGAMDLGGAARSITVKDYVNGADATISGAVSNGGIIKAGNGTLSLGGNNSYNGGTTVNGGTLSVAMLAVGGFDSSIGASSNAPANLVINGGVLQYTGVTVATDRNFTIGDDNARIDGSGSGALTISGSAAFATSNAARRLTLIGAFAWNTDGTFGNRNAFSGSLSDNGTGALSVVKSKVLQSRWLLVVILRLG